MDIKLTQFSHGAGCGCKLSPKVLDEILKSHEVAPDNGRLLVGNHSRDDAAVYDLGNGSALISTTDFFMPIVDDPFDFGRISACNAISDVYAMGGVPILAIAILGMPVDKLPTSAVRLIVEGGRNICAEAGIPLAGGHSIDCPEPVFGLAVNGLVDVGNLKKNNTAREGDFLFLTKPIGVGIITTAEKRGIARLEDKRAALKWMTRLNKIGAELGRIKGVHALTDVSGFGLLGHASEMAEGSGLTALINEESVQRIADLESYLHENCFPGGTRRNWDSYGHKVGFKGRTSDDLDISSEFELQVLCDPQTSGGLLISVSEEAVYEVHDLMLSFDLDDLTVPVGRMIDSTHRAVLVE